VTVFVVKGIKPAKLKVGRVRLEILNALRREGTTHKKELRKTVATWRGDKPKFESLVGLDHPPGAATVVTGPTGNTKGVQKWVWLNDGTRIRWALMSRDWRSKTKVRSFRSGAGAGRVVLAGRRAMTARGIGPRPGIEAREWTKTLSQRRRKPFTRRMIQAMQRGAHKAF